MQPVDVAITPSSMFGGWVTDPKRAPGEKPFEARGEVAAAKQKVRPSPN